jgi:hypothetical protein
VRLSLSSVASNLPDMCFLEMPNTSEVCLFFRDPDFTGFSLRGENTV